MSLTGHSRRFVQVRATSGYPPELTVKAKRQAFEALAQHRHARA